MDSQHVKASRRLAVFQRMPIPNARTPLLGLLAAGIVCFAASPSLTAQEDGAEADTLLPEIIVTARRREENIQNVPLSITAFDALAIERRNIMELDDVARFTAGFAFEDFDGGRGGPVIRNQPTINVVSREQTTATFLDGVYMPRSWLVDLGATNLQRIEVVKGPQSARYGRNAFAGAINYIPMKSSGTTEADVTLGFGADEMLNYGVSGSMPLAGDQVSIRVSFDHSEYDGSWKNAHPLSDFGYSPGTSGNVGGWDTNTYSVNLAIRPSDALHVDLAYYGFDREEEARASSWRSTGLGLGNCGTFDLGQFRLFCGEPPGPGDSVYVEPRGFSRQSDADIVKLSADYRFNAALSLSYVFGRVDANTLSAVSAESDPVNCGTILAPFLLQGNPRICNFQASPLGEVEYDSHEVRLAFEPDGALGGSVGAFLSDGEDRNYFVSVSLPVGQPTPLNITRTTSAPLGPFPFDPAGFSNLVVRDDRTNTDVLSLFGEINYALANNATRLGLEVRYTTEDISTYSARTGRTFTREDDFVTPRVTIDHDLNANAMLYGLIARGAKAGGFNSGGIMPENQVFEPEFNLTLEAGLKATMLEGAAVFSVAVYSTKWSDMQVTAADPDGTILNTAIIRNLGDATIRGIELEGSIAVNRNLSIDAAFSYSDGAYDSATDTVFARFAGRYSRPPCDDVVCRSDGVIDGNELPRSPATQAAIGAQWSDELPTGSGSYYIRADLGYQSSFFGDTVNVAKFPSRSVTNFRTGLDIGNWKVAVWARNLFDEKYASNALTILQASSNNLQGAYYGERRTYGLEVSYHYE